VKVTVDNFDIEKVYGGHTNFDGYHGNQRSINALEYIYMNGALLGSIPQNAIAQTDSNVCFPYLAKFYFLR
jgi:hypothetical protein